MTERLKSLMFTLLCLAGVAMAQAGSSAPAKPAATAPAATVGDFSGTYTFLRDGEDLQINVQDGKLDGFISRFEESDPDKILLLQHLFKKASLTADEVSFTTETIHGVWFEFKGKVRRGQGKTPSDEGYYVLEGTITRYETSVEKKTSAKSREAQFRSHPLDLGASFPGKKKK